MKNKYIYILMALSALFSCEIVDESGLDNKEEVEKVSMTFTATIEDDAQSKTVLDGNVGDALRKVMWEPGDCIGVIGTGMTANSPQKFTLNETSQTELGTFSGEIDFNKHYTAFYPYDAIIQYYCNSSAVIGHDGFYFDLPMTQKYTPGSFDSSCAPMIASAPVGEPLQFKNICGLLSIQLTGTDVIKSITFVGTDAYGSKMPVAGTYSTNWSESEVCTLATVSTELLKYSVTLECEEAVALDPDTPTSFYFVLPPATYHTFTLMITTEDGKIMFKQGTKPLTIKRSDAAYAKDFQYVENQYIDLSDKGNANCYILPSAGLYSFDATVVGNGDYGYISSEPFYPQSSSLSPYSVALLWEEVEGMVTGLTLEDGRVKFIHNGVRGNALVAVKDESEKIIWSWHLWMTDQPFDQVYVNSKGTFTVMDRNIGAIRADRGVDDQWKQSTGTLYQWGRKEPFRHEITPSRANTQAYLNEAVSMPTTFFYGYGNWVKEENRSDYFWSTEKKTIYDPCPVGYRVSTSDIWAGFIVDGSSTTDRRSSINAEGSFDYGLNFYIDDNATLAWYPAVYSLMNWGDVEWNSNDVHYWSANSLWAENAERLYFYYTVDDMSLDNQDLGYRIQIRDHTDNKGNAFPVRCMKEE